MAGKETFKREVDDSPPITQREDYVKPGQANLRHSSVVKRGRGRPKKTKMRGGALSNGRHPFKALANDYLNQHKTVWARSTYEKAVQKYNYLNGVFEELKQQGKIDSMNPGKFGRKEIFAFETWMQEEIHGRGKDKDIVLDPATRKKYRGLVKSLMRWCDNYTYDKLLEKGLVERQQPNKEVRTITYDDFSEMLEYTRRNRKGWSEQVRYFIIACYGYMGLRNQELRLADIQDLNRRKWTFKVMHPKGEQTYGSKRTIPVVEPLRPIVTEFLQLREQHLKEKGIQYARPLIPVLKKIDGEWEACHYSSHRFRAMALDLGKTMGIDLQIRILRASCGQFCKDRGMNIEKISKLLGHSSTKTTEQYYCRVKDEAMFEEMNSLFSDEMEGRGTKNPLIERKSGYTGYA